MLLLNQAIFGSLSPEDQNKQSALKTVASVLNRPLLIKMDVFIFCAAKYDYISISSEPWDRGIQWQADGVKKKKNHRGTFLLCRKIAASAKPEMKADSSHKMSISPRRVEHLNTLENLDLGGKYFIYCQDR